MAGVATLTRPLDEASYLQALMAEEAILCQEHLRPFVRAGFDVIEPGRTYQHGWHIDAICDHLEAVVDGDIINLLINIPYRTMKSVIVSQLFPPWVWLQKRISLTAGPQVRFLSLSHASDLATRDAMVSRSCIESEWYRTSFPHVPPMKHDQDQKAWYANQAGGYRMALGFDSGITGKDGDVRVIDDPHDALSGMYSEADRKRTIDTWRQKIASRKTDLAKSATVLVMQRLHPEDMSGVFLEQDDVVHLMLPMEYEPKRMCETRIGFKDPRTKEDELLWPARITPAVVKAEKKTLGSNGTKAQLQQRPEPIGGTILKREWFQRYEQRPREMIAAKMFVHVFQFWDTAQKKETTSAYWVCITMGVRLDGSIYLLNVDREQMTYPEGKRRVGINRDLWKPNGVIVEDKSTGQSLIQEIPGLVPFEPEGDKATRLSVESPHIEGGGVFLPEDDALPWVKDFLDEVCLVPSSNTMDQADALSMGLKYIREKQMIPVLGPGPGLERESDWHGR